MPIDLHVYIDATHLRNEFATLTNYQFKQGISRGINRTAEKAQTIARTAVKEVYTISQKGVSKTIELKKSRPSTLTAYVKADSTPVDMREFKHQFISSGGQRQKIARRKGANGRPIVTAKLPSKRNLGTFVIEAQKGKKRSVPYAFLIPSLPFGVFGRGVYKPGKGSWGFKVRKAGETRNVGAKGNEKITKMTSVTVHAAAINEKVQTLMVNRITPIFLDKIVHELQYKRGDFG